MMRHDPTLEGTLEQFAGWLVVISYEPWFLDRIATHIFAFEGNSGVTFLHGDFTEHKEVCGTLDKGILGNDIASGGSPK